MQTFLISENPADTAKILDNRRLGKQRVEALTILKILLGQSNSDAWVHHPAVLMWKGYERWLHLEYISAIMNEWENKGFKNDKCEKTFNELGRLMIGFDLSKPDWFSEAFFNSHKSNLIRKKPEFYKPLWPNIPDNLPYIWPVSNLSYKVERCLNLK
jgi:hypothetical protein